uniref:Candidate secreted effector n=1 Tax=Meloidogyne incognita TaxID=6306 RepID=A0A914LFZ5_MELIC
MALDISPLNFLLALLLNSRRNRFTNSLLLSVQQICRNSTFSRLINGTLLFFLFMLLD